jgi:hypothetical protein
LLAAGDLFQQPTDKLDMNPGNEAAGIGQRPRRLNEAAETAPLPLMSDAIR